MKAVLLAALFAASANADLVATNAAGHEIRLFNLPCVHGHTLSRIAPEHRADFRKLQAWVNGGLKFGCWRPIPEESAIFILMEGRPGFTMRAGAFADHPGV